MMVVLGGIGTLWGGAVGAALIVQLNDYLATAGFQETGIVTGAIFILVVLLFRRGIWGTAQVLIASRRTKQKPDEEKSVPEKETVAG
jgi:branched-chain amino acid transport system permease protein